MRILSQKSLLLVSVASAALCLGSAAWAQTRAFDVPAEDANKSIPEFARQAGIQIIAPGDQLRGIRTPALKGPLDIHAALSELLAGTNTKIASDDGQTIVLSVQPKNVQAASNDGAALPGPSNIESVVVTGTNIRGIDVLPAEIRSIDRAEIANGGFSSIDQVLASIPQNFTDLTSFTGSVQGASGPSRNNGFDHANSIDLRGLGSDSTLVLVNGERRPGAVFGYLTDLSGIPVSAIERVDVVNGGESSIYGADAVAGVVNVITRRSFSGMETGAYAGLATQGGGERVQFDQTVGIDKEKGGFVLAYDYTRDTGIDLVQRKAAVPIPGVVTLTADTLLPHQVAQSVLLSGHYELTNDLSAYFDGGYHFYQGSVADSEILQAANEVESLPVTTQHGEYDYSGGLKYRSGDWNFDLTGNYGIYRDASNETAIISTLTGTVLVNSPNVFSTRSTLASGRFVANGSLPEILGIDAKVAAGAEVRHEYLFTNLSTRAAPYESGQRDVQSGFAEFYLPIVTNGFPWLRKLDFSLSGRYDHYSDFGDTSNYLVGTTWQPADDLTARATYSTAFRPPALGDLNHPSNIGLLNIPDPLSATGTSTLFQISAGSPASLLPETAKTWSVGGDYKPDFFSGLTLSTTYFGVEYRNRIDTPTASSAQTQTVLQNSQIYGPLINRAPTAALLAAQIAQAASVFNSTGTAFNAKTQSVLSVFPNIVVFNDNTTNAASESVNTLDFSARLDRDAGWGGQWHAQFDAQKFLDFNRKLLANQTATSQIDSIGFPTDFKLRAGLGWSTDLVTAFVFGNYSGSYQDIRVAPAASVSAWTTIDLNIRVNLGAPDSPLPLDQTYLAFTVTNLFDQSPPRTSPDSTGIIFDGTNANPIGRYIGLRLTKSW